MKLSEGFTKLVPSLAMGVLYTASLGCLTMALKRIELSLAYAVWSGVGTALIAAIGIIYFREVGNPSFSLFSHGVILLQLVSISIMGLL